MELTGADENGGKSVMVAVRKAYKSYGNGKIVLQDFNMTVHQGSIYAFLGPSGCGKTTVLSCLAGERVLDSGQITLGVQYKDQIGYMPQDTSLSLSLTIWEAMNFYRLLFGFSKGYMKKRMRETLSFFDIPGDSRELGTLSGGEQRRVSLCIALLHDPPLLILDEPTVGLDPVLSYRTWEYFDELTRNQNKTIIITTHYVEEAKQATTVGMMRDGVLLVEGCPRTIMAKNGTDSLEYVFLRLSQKQEINSIQHVSDEDVHYHKTVMTGSKEGKSPIKSRQPFCFGHVSSHMWKHFYWLIHNKLVFLFLLTLPMTSCLLFGLAIGRNPEYLKMGIINEELENGRAVDCRMPITLNCSDPIHSSCWYMEHLEKKKMILVDFEDEASALQASKKNEVWGYIQFKRNYTSSLMDRLDLNLNTPMDIIDSSEVSIRIDMSNQNIGNLLKRDMYFAYYDYLIEFYKTCGWPVKAAGIPIGYEPAVYGSLYPDFTTFGVPAVYTLCLFFSGLALVAGAILMEKQEGVLERNTISGLTLPETFVADTIFCLGFISIQAVSMCVVFFIVFSVPFKGSFLLLGCLSIPCIICGICYGIFLAVLFENVTAATPFGLGSFLSLTFISGLFWPFEAMHKGLQIVANCLPLTLVTKAFHSVIFRGYGYTNPIMYSSALMLLTWIIILNIATYIVVRRKK